MKNAWDATIIQELPGVTAEPLTQFDETMYLNVVISSEGRKSLNVYYTNSHPYRGWGRLSHNQEHFQKCSDIPVDFLTHENPEWGVFREVPAHTRRMTGWGYKAGDKVQDILKATIDPHDVAQMAYFKAQLPYYTAENPGQPAKFLAEHFPEYFATASEVEAPAAVAAQDRYIAILSI